MFTWALFSLSLTPPAATPTEETRDYDHVEEWVFASPAPQGQVIAACFIVAVCTVMYIPGMFFFIRRRHHRALAARFPITHLPMVTGIYAFSVIQTASLIYGKPAFCDLTEAMFVIMPCLTAHFVLQGPTVVLQADLASQKITMATPDSSSEYGDGVFYWMAHMFVQPRIRVIGLFIVSVLHVGFYLLLRYLVVLPGDCNRTAIMAWCCHAIINFLFLAYFQIRLFHIRDPFFIRTEIIIATVLNSASFVVLPVIYAFAPQVLPASFDFRWVQIEAPLQFLFVNLCLPILLTSDRAQTWLARRTSRDYVVSPEDAKSTDTSSTIFALSQGVNVFQAVLSNPVLLEEFTQFTATEWSAENILFYKAVEDFKVLYRQTPNLAFERARFIYNRFIKAESRVQVNLDDPMRRSIGQLIQREILSEHMFDAAQKSVLELMERDSFHKWQRTNGFRLALEKAMRERSSNSGTSLLSASAAAPHSKRSTTGERGTQTSSVVELTEVM